MESEIPLPSSLSPSRNNAKVQPRYLSPRISSRHDSCKHGKHLEVEPEANSLNLKKTIKNTKKLSQSAVSNQISHLDNTKFPDHTEIHQSEKNQGKHVDSDNEYPKAKIAQKNTNSSVKNIVSQLSKAAPLKEGPPHVIAEGKASIASKTKAHLIRSSSKNKSSRNLSIRKKHETELKENTETSEVSEAESENGQENTVKLNSVERAKSHKRTTSSANRIVLSLQMKKLRSIRRSTTHKYDLSYPLNKVNGASEKDSPLESSSSPRLSKAKSSSKSSSTHVELKSDKQNVDSLGSDSSLEVTEPESFSESFSIPRLSKAKSRKKSSSTHVEHKSKRQNAESLGSDSSLEVTELQCISESSSIPRLSKAKSRKKSSSTHVELKSNKQDAESLGSDSSLDVTELKSISESSSIPRLSKAKSRKKSSWTHVEHKSSKQNAEPLESEASLEVTKLKSISENKQRNESEKKKSSQHQSISNMVSRKFMSIMRSSSGRNKNKAVNTDTNEEETSFEVNGVQHTLPRSSSTHTEGNATGPSKLKFKSGTGISRSSSVNGARRLWFNIGKVANSENDTVANNGLTRKRSLRRKSSVRYKKFELQNVVLKHQKTLKKKDEESLFNEVIEKTASKLIGSKKSKVKALVGAFENVISLLESKPAPVV